MRHLRLRDLQGPHAAPLAVVFPLNNAAKTARARFKLRVPASHTASYDNVLLDVQ